jgi:hypothetical protein
MRYRLLKLPDNIEACHDLINILVAELNEYHDAMRPNDKEDSIPSAQDKKFSASFPTDYWNNCAGANGGVEFEGFGGHRPPSAYSETVCEGPRGSYVNCPF